MQVVGLDFLQTQLEMPHFSAKAVFNERGAIFFEAKAQHRDQSLPDVRYADNYKGNALAAMLLGATSEGARTDERVVSLEIRYHEGFSDARVVDVLERLTAQPGLDVIRTWRVTYQGRVIPMRTRE